MKSSPHHSFDIDLAIQYGVHEAILIHHFQHWIRLNAKSKYTFKEGRTWTYQTRDYIRNTLPYLSDKEIRGALNRLIEKQIIIKGNFNKNRFDRTTWYAFVNESDFLNNLYDIPKGPMEKAKGPIRKVQKGQTIPDTKTDSENTSSSSSPPSESKRVDEEEGNFSSKFASLPYLPKELEEAKQNMKDLLRSRPGHKIRDEDKWISVDIQRQRKKKAEVDQLKARESEALLKQAVSVCEDYIKNKHAYRDYIINLLVGDTGLEIHTKSGMTIMPFKDMGRDLQYLRC